MRAWGGPVSSTICEQASIHGAFSHEAAIIKLQLHVAAEVKKGLLVNYAAAHSETGPNVSAGEHTGIIQRGAAADLRIFFNRAWAVVRARNTRKGAVPSVLSLTDGTSGENRQCTLVQS